MPHFRIHRMKDQWRESFRWAPHVAALAVVKPKDYEPSGEVEARHEYEAWSALKGSERALQLGDLLETETGELRICKYVGLEPAQWLIVEAPAPPVEREAQ